MAWAFRTNLPTPNLDRRLLFPLALTSPIYTLRDLWTLFQELKPTTPGGCPAAWRSRSSCSRASAT